MAAISGRLDGYAVITPHLMPLSSFLAKIGELGIDTLNDVFYTGRHFHDGLRPRYNITDLNDEQIENISQFAIVQKRKII